MPDCMYGTHMCAGALGGQERPLHLQEPELLVVANYHVNVGDGSQT
ncbi:rCG52297 [Rattus norvegicus]|uniref:RCG52297 n=1 Tax=Rattus norvegicus TaxID=10116 RepID=A6K0M4_RAT|nr:rCG52297 [Rattus norvegicus]